MTDTPVKNTASAFDQGHLAGKSVSHMSIENPFPLGSAQHNNFEVGRRFGVSHARHTPIVTVPDADETEN